LSNETAEKEDIVEATEKVVEQVDVPALVPESETGEYQVLARKYRPKDFSELKGQDALVQTLTNAINSGRIAHAFMLTGVRGVGKTTTARIVARALNCIGPDGKGEATPTPCGECEPCKAIAGDRHVDVLEMDAASRTGVDDIREIIDSVQYAPASARYKIYIIDEIHMLSKQAFNALLKTLEEPPEHVKFIFATTEIRKVPITVLSRCQRFDLRRIDMSILSEYFMELTNKEGKEAEEEAIALIARAADGSARDGLSLLDQAISLAEDKVTEQQVRDMLGLADRTIVFDLLEELVSGKSEETLKILEDLHKSGADPLVILQDLLELTHFLTKLRAAPESANDATLPEAERIRGTELSQKLSMPVLTRTWQILLKGISEIQNAPMPQQALEMVLLRLIYAADLPTPEELVKKLQMEPASPSPLKNASLLPSNRGGQATPSMGMNAIAQDSEQDVQQEDILNPTSFLDIVNLFNHKREALLKAQLCNYVRPIKCERGRLEVSLKDGASQKLTNHVAKKLQEWTGERWVISVSKEGNAPTLSEIEQQEKKAEMEEIKSNPIVEGVLLTFPGAKITKIREVLEETKK